jgi:hypothetical protein
LLRGPLARQTLQFDEDRPGPLILAVFSALVPAPFGMPNGDFTGMKSNIYDE